MHRLPIGVLALLLLAPALWALDDSRDQKKSDKPPPEKAQTPAQQYRALVSEFQKEQQDFFKAYGKATPEERQKLQFPRPQKYAGRMLELAEKHPKDAAAVDALAWVVSNVRAGADANKALHLLLTDHNDSKQLGNVCQSLRYSGSADTEGNLRVIMQKSPHHDVQGQACLALAQFFKDRSQANNTAAGDAEKMTKEAVTLLERVVKDYGDVKLYGRMLGKLAGGELFELRHLIVGKEVPEIQGEDLDGKKFKLSDYRGKVVLLDFWGNW